MNRTSQEHMRKETQRQTKVVELKNVNGTNEIRKRYLNSTANTLNPTDPDILAYTSAGRPRADVQNYLHDLARKLAKARDWTVAIKKLIVIHKTLREGDPTFREELVNFQQRGRVLHLANLKDDSSPIVSDVGK
ncbi:hypothetical protein L1887_27757 [Cichorium endivia]|nr:hypothetical protein L1887_27757 [Cichorium endivia]